MGHPHKWTVGVDWMVWAFPLSVGFDHLFNEIVVKLGPFSVAHCWDEGATGTSIFGKEI